MNYIPRKITGMTIEQIDQEIDRMYYDQYAYGKSIDRPRLWDLLETKRQLEVGQRSMVESD